MEQETLTRECKELEKGKGGSERGGRFPGLGDPIFKRRDRSLHGNWMGWGEVP